jgi:hypothetical protein
MAYVQRVGGSLALLMTMLMGAAMGQSPGSGTVVLTSGVYAAQGSGEATPASRLSGDWRSSPTVVIPGSQPPGAHAFADLGPAPAGTRVDRMLLLLEPSTAQRRALTRNWRTSWIPSPPRYHHWLTAAAFADAYAN